MKRSSEQSAESDERGSAAEREAGDDKDNTEAEHNPPHYLPYRLDLPAQFCNWHLGNPAWQRYGDSRTFFWYSDFARFIQ